MNPIINQLMFGFQNNFINMFNKVKAAQNPNTLMQSMMQSNPQLNETLNYITKNGGNAKQLYYAMCQRKNVDPNIIINKLNNT